MRLILSAPKIWFYQGAVDFRKAIDGLVALVHAQLDINPTEGIFVFHNRTKDKLKVLAWHGNGFVLLYKRMEKGKFTVISDQSVQSVTLGEKQLSWLLAGLDWGFYQNSVCCDVLIYRKSAKLHLLIASISNELPTL